MKEIHEFFKKRRAGILLHPTSLPRTPGNGDLGSDAYRFVDFLVESGLSVWQTLPINPPHEDLSPYQCQSVHAANPLLINLEKLVEKGWLAKTKLAYKGENEPRAASSYRYACLQEARRGFEKNAKATDRQAYDAFKQAQGWWVDDFALYRALKAENNNAIWTQWPAQYRDRDPVALTTAKHRLAETIEQNRFEQFLFFTQWHDLKQYANEHGIYLFGDIPIFVALDSVDVWVDRRYFQLDAQGNPTVVAGVPPDYFSATGQLWGNPHYDWTAMQADQFKWWINRLRTQQYFFDLVRIDHFRGFEACWAVPATAKVASEGRWVKVPGDALFTKLQETVTLPLVAEDLGIITAEVVALRDKFGLPGMRILQFAFGDDQENPYLPHNHISHCVVYTGTHDNNTTLGWFQGELSEHMQRVVCAYLGANPSDMPWPLIEAAFASVANLAMIPMQDALSADASQRMNIPGTATGNWRWRLDWSQIPTGLAHRLCEKSKHYGRI